MNIKTKDIINIDKTIAKSLFEINKYPWEVLPQISNYIIELGKTLDKDLYIEEKENIWIAKNANIATSALIESPCIIDEFAEIRHCAYIRGNTIIGKNAVIGNSCEIKNSIIFDNSQIPHFNYVGDSILGYHAHLGAGVIIANLKNDKSNITIKHDNEKIETNLRKMGAIIGDNVDIGCNSTVFPGTIIYPNTTIYPLTRVRNVIPSNSIEKSENNIIRKEENLWDIYLEPTA